LILPTHRFIGGLRDFDVQRYRCGEGNFEVTDTGLLGDHVDEFVGMSCRSSRRIRLGFLMEKPQGLSDAAEETWMC